MINNIYVKFLIVISDLNKIIIHYIIYYKYRL